MDNIVSLQASHEATKGNFIATVISIGDLTSGTSNGKDWTKKTITVEDVTARIALTAWGDEIKLFELGKTYNFENPWWKEYEGQWGLNIGKFCKVTLCENPTVPHPGPPTVETPTVTNKVEAPKPQNRPEMNPNLREFVTEEAIIMLQIQDVCKEVLGLGTDGAQLGMWTKEIYRQSKVIKFEKAS